MIDVLLSFQEELVGPVSLCSPFSLFWCLKHAAQMTWMWLSLFFWMWHEYKEYFYKRTNEAHLLLLFNLTTRNQTFVPMTVGGKMSVSRFICSFSKIVKIKRNWWLQMFLFCFRKDPFPGNLRRKFPISGFLFKSDFCQAVLFVGHSCLYIWAFMWLSEKLDWMEVRARDKSTWLHFSSSYRIQIKLYS